MFWKETFECRTIYVIKLLGKNMINVGNREANIEVSSKMMEAVCV